MTGAPHLAASLFAGGPYEDAAPASVPDWTLIFADVLVILIALFVLVFSMQVPPRLGAAETARGAPAQGFASILRTDTDYLAGVLSERLRRVDGGSRLAVIAGEGEVSVGGRPEDWLDSSLKASPVSEFAALLARLGNPVHVAVRPESGASPALALEQGVAVARRLEAHGLGRSVPVFLDRRGPGARAVALVVRVDDTR